MVEPIKYSGQTAKELFGARDEMTANVEAAVKTILVDVRIRGDGAVKEYSAKFDGFTGDKLEVERQEIDEAYKELSPEYIEMLKRAIANIRAFHGEQVKEGFEIDYGDRIVGQKVTPVGCAGIYVPGGTAAYPSTVLMNAIPAKIAGVNTVIMSTPVKEDGRVKPEILVAADLCGVDRIFKIGGAQAIAAMAYGTETVPKVDVITGPGRDYVATAKKLVSGITCGIDMVAGPSEILVIADGKANAAHVAADLLSQAEHDKIASAVLITDSEKLAYAVSAELAKQLVALPRVEIARESLDNYGKIIICESLETAVELANRFAPEHLELAVEEPFALMDGVKNAGSVFLGYYTPEAIGDYYAGANHTLPTSGTARFASPLSVDDFVKTTQYISYSRRALIDAAQDVVSFAKSEGLDGHAKSITIRTGENE